MKNEFDYLNDVKMDFSCYEKYEKEKKIMKRNKKIFIIAACITALSFTAAFAYGPVSNIIKTITTGHNIYHQIDPEIPHPLSEELKGKIFDENGVALEALKKSDFDNIYDKDGNKITSEKFAQIIEESTGGLVRVSDDNSNPEENHKNFSDLTDAQNNAVFDIKTPSYLPDGYQNSKIFTYKNDDGSVSGKYMTLLYKNQEGKEIYIFERILDEETAFEAGTDGSLEEISLNGQKAVIMNDASLEFETEDNVSVIISGKGNISKDELIKIGESMR